MYNENFVGKYKYATVRGFLRMLKEDTRVILREYKSNNTTVPMKVNTVCAMYKKLLDKAVADIYFCDDVIGFTAVVVSYI